MCTIFCSVTDGNERTTDSAVLLRTDIAHEIGTGMEVVENLARILFRGA